MKNPRFSSKRSTIVVGLLLGALICLIFVWMKPSGKSPGSLAVSAPAPRPVSVHSKEIVPASQAVPELSQPDSDEISRTGKMYLAHAPLREPEIADPDSAANRRVLQTMVEKSLRRANDSTAAPASN